MKLSPVPTINISSTFLVRAKCKHCGGGATLSFRVRKSFIWKDVQSKIIADKLMRNMIDQLSDNWYLDSDPKFFTTLGNFTWTVNDAFKPTLQRTRGSDIHPNDNLYEIAVCECGQTRWKQDMQSNKNKPEIINRKGRYDYPKRFLG